MGRSPRGATATFALLFLAYTLIYMDRQVIAGVAEPLRHDLGLSNAAIGALQSATLAGVALFALPAAMLLDRRSRRDGLALITVLWSAVLLLTARCRGLPSLLALRTASGIGGAGCSAGSTAMLAAAWPAHQRARVLGLFNAAIPLGAALGTVLSSLLAARTGAWSVPFSLIAIAGLLCGAAISRLPDAPVVPAPASSWRELLKLRGLRLTYAGFAMNVFASTALMSWLPQYLARSYGLPLPAAGRRAGLILVLALVGSPLGGWLADRWALHQPRARALTAAVSSLVAALLLAAGLHRGGTTLGLICLVAWGIVGTAYLAPASAITQDVVPPGQGATAWGGCVVAMYLLGGAYSPYLIGALSDALGAGDGSPAALRVALYLAPLASLLAALLFWRASHESAQSDPKTSGEPHTAPQETHAHDR